MPKKWDPIAFAKQVLRRATRKTRGYNQARKAASRREDETKKDGTKSKRYRVYYTCAGCGGRDFTAKQIQMDHISPIGLHTEMETWIKHLFCDATSYQCLCLSCHKHKTKEDRKQIANHKKELKKLKGDPDGRKPKSPAV